MRSPLVQLCVVAFVGLLSIGGYVFWYHMVSQKSAEVASLEAQIVAATNNVKHIASARAALGEIAGDEAQLQSYFVPESKVVSFITDLQDRGTAQKSTVEVVSVSTIDSTTHPALQLSLTAKGSFDAVMRTVGAIEYAPYDISISTLSLVNTAKGAWQASVMLTVGSIATPTATSTKP